MTVTELAQLPAGTVLLNPHPDITQVAIRSALEAADRAWFVFDVANGGWYTPGTELVEWPLYPGLV